ncbi:hypothetical protein HUT18_11435 [Streptomyces sp. NA04227]|uniref:hypothetical protein n=1 Tax=Streptomyces sp. NA04227 TaxID=2742136 RepID=UPI001590759D|nr:hypothetical protein [Streptomyces sp. NA04227]QKW06912.1 hypothetical protein HUT18_11435 [Streptomyces sp. NA04227]
MRQQFYWHGIHVPYITQWSSEQGDSGRLTARLGPAGERIEYAQEHQADRREGALWVRSRIGRGRGAPDFVRVHPMRQRQAILNDLCQVCGNYVPLIPDEEARLYVVGGYTPVTDGERSTSPPTHPECALEAIGACPKLSRHVTALVRETPLWGVSGALIHPKTLKPLDDGAATFQPFSAPEFNWTLASALVVALHGVTPITTADVTNLARTQPELAAVVPEGARP